MPRAYNRRIWILLKSWKGCWSKACNIKARIIQICFYEWWNIAVMKTTILKVFCILCSYLRFSPNFLTSWMTVWFAVCFKILQVEVVFFWFELVEIFSSKCIIFTKVSFLIMNLVFRIYNLTLLLWRILRFPKWSVQAVGTEVFICSLLILNCVDFVEAFH